MKKAMKIFVVLLAAAVLVLAGCNRGSGGSSAGGAQQVTVELFDRGTDGGRTQVDNNEWTRWIQEKVKKDLNIDLTFHPVGRWSENTDIINLMASGSAPDLCYTYASISGFRDQGGLYDLAPYVDRLLPNAKRLLGADPAFPGKDFIYRNLQSDGKMYSIPSYRVALAQRNVFIRKDWLDALGLPVPTTLQQFHDALVAFRDRDPGNVGNRIIPFVQGSDLRWGLANFMNNFIDPNLSDRDRYVYSIAGRSLMYPGYKEGVRLMNQWFNDGLIFRDFALMSGDDGNNFIKSGVVGAFSGNWDLPYRTDYQLIEDMRLNVPGADFVPVDLAVNNKEIMDKVGLQIFVPVFAKNAEAALRYLNWLTIPENYEFLQRGQQGVNHVMENGVPRILALEGGNPWIQNSSQNIDLTLPMNGVEMGSDELNARVMALSYGAFPADVIVNAYAISVKNARAPTVVNTPTSMDGMYQQTLQDKADALLAQSLVAPPANFDRIWDAGVEDWMRSGGQEVMDERIQIASTEWR